ncbi:MAG: DUF1934 domain-containing protein [Muribaculaceae bacterium]|nr:DUF1934 domain-containing protein [Roseburia sp.]MCM1430645.1 DUF1934 domain-containing protein [Muribaculaceae bacterium]MCM1491912.1 DUF1934 domain-containing protein [Muribaculaceae bacterium]
MTKDVIIKVQGMQLMPGQQNDSVEVIAPGTYYFKNGKHYLLYEEVMEGYEAPTKNIVKVSEDFMELTKRGVVNAHMLFEKNKQNITCYYTPFGGLQIGVDASAVSVTKGEDELGILVCYSLDINNQHIANCRLQMTAASRGRERFQIL